MESLSLGSLAGDIAIVFSLILLGAIFVAAEIALISLRESQVRQLASRGKRGAKVAELATNPNRFLAAAQVGVTVCGFLSAALGAERLGVYVIPKLEELGLSRSASNATSLVGVTLIIAYSHWYLVNLFRSDLLSFAQKKSLLLAQDLSISLQKYFVHLFGCSHIQRILLCDSLE